MANLRPQQPDFTHGLIHFALTRAITHELKTQLRAHARSADYPHQPQASRLMQYCVSRGAQLGPIGTNFGTATRLTSPVLIITNTGNSSACRQG